MLQKMIRRKSGFTLIELMIVVVIIGILAALAIPAFIRFVKRSKTGEATSLAKSLYEGAKTYYDRENWSQGLTVVGGSAAASTACVVSSQETPRAPSEEKYMPDITATTMTSFAALGFAPSSPIYFQYVINAVATGCGNSAGNSAVYTFEAIGDLDGDDTNSTFQLAVGSDNDNNLYHAPGFYVVDELE